MQLAIPAPRMKIAKALLILASDDASNVTGVELFVHGGLAQT
jgi:NAD(P)-dependent dehydrogenase (short-subunit alcohol dehydrogenase family)